MYVSLNNKLLAPSSVISFGNASTLLITCLSVNSRPRVNLIIYDSTSSAAIDISSQQASKIEVCDSFEFCQTSVSVMLTPGYTYFNNIKSIACLANNLTSPYDLSTSSVSYNLDFNGNQNIN